MMLKKTIIISVFIHVLILSLVWIGFPVFLPRDKVIFTYSGSFMPLEDVSKEKALMTKWIDGKQIFERDQEGAFFAPWLRVRALNKPKG